MKREKLEEDHTLVKTKAKRPRQRKPFRFTYKPESPAQREARKAADRRRSYKRRCKLAAPKSLVPADATFIQLMKAISERRNEDERAWSLLSSYLATGRTIVRERLPDRTHAGK
ncbi:hypothetical protein [Bradyrhizobium viridifuturi]|uniref:hypothetical protein n=1 Tax=Bradyrhizobium viridifuturi TaxID=1654716 RepID=UPI000AF5C2ED|nr:hypothetical protein [Bradyrhizobium viridifuturi]